MFIKTQLGVKIHPKYILRNGVSFSYNNNHITKRGSSCISGFSTTNTFQGQLLIGFDPLLDEPASITQKSFAVDQSPPQGNFITPIPTTMGTASTTQWT